MQLKLAEFKNSKSKALQCNVQVGEASSAKEAAYGAAAGPGAAHGAGMGLALSQGKAAWSSPGGGFQSQQWAG